MSDTTTRLRPRFRTEERTNAPSEATAPFGEAQETQLERLKERLLHELLAETTARPDLNVAYRRAADDATSLAWLTPFPLFFLPALFKEKAAEARERAERQRALLTHAAKCKVVV
jgi:hypothetical protein